MLEKTIYDPGFAYTPMKYAPPVVKIGDVEFVRTGSKVGKTGVLVEYTVIIGKYRIVTYNFNGFDVYFGEKKLTRETIKDGDFVIHTVKNLPEEPLHEVNNFPHLIEIDENGPLVRTVLRDGIYDVYLDGRKKLVEKLPEPIEKIDVVYPLPGRWDEAASRKDEGPRKAFVVYSDDEPLIVAPAARGSVIRIQKFVENGSAMTLTETPPNPLTDELGAAVLYGDTLISQSGFIYGDWKSDDETTARVRRVITLGVNPVNPDTSLYYMKTDETELLIATKEYMKLSSENPVPVAVTYIGKSKFVALNDSKTEYLRYTGVNINIDLSFDSVLEYDGDRIVMRPYAKKVPVETYRKILRATDVKINEVLPGFPEDGRIENTVEREFHVVTPNGLEYYATVNETDEKVHVFRVFGYALYRLEIPWDEKNDFWSEENVPAGVEKVLEIPPEIKVPEGTKTIAMRDSIRFELPSGDVVRLTKDEIITQYGAYDIELLAAVDYNIEDFMLAAKLV